MAYSKIQSKPFRTSANVASVACTISPTAGNDLFVPIHYCNSGGAILLSGITDQLGNALTYVECGTGIFTTGTFFGDHLVYIYGISAGVTGLVITLASAASNGISGVAEEFHGLKDSATGIVANTPLVNTASLTANAVTSGSASTPSGYPSCAYAYAVDNSRSNHAPSAGTSPNAFNSGTIVVHPNTNSNAGLTEDFRITASTISATFTNTGSANDLIPVLMLIVPETSASPPTISGVSASAYLGAMTITGTGFGSGTNTVTIDGCVQAITTVTSTTILVPSVTRSDGTTQIGYGAHTLTVNNSITGASAPFAITLTPQAGGQYVVLGALNPDPTLRISAIPDYATGMQMAAYGATGFSGTGVFNLYTDGSFEEDDPTITGFFVEVYNGTVWTAAAFETLVILPANVTAPTIATQPTAQTTTAGLTATFTATGAGTSLSWQATRNGVLIPGSAGTGTAATYTTPATVFATDNGAQYAFIFTNTGGSAATITVPLTVLPVAPTTTVPNFKTGTWSQAGVSAALTSVSLSPRFPVPWTGSVAVTQSIAAGNIVPLGTVITVQALPNPTGVKSVQLQQEEALGALLSYQMFVSFANLSTGPADVPGAVYRFFRVPSDARVFDIQTMNDANPVAGSVSSYQIGVLFPNGGGVIVPGSDQILVPPGMSFDTAQTTWVSQLSPVIVGGVPQLNNVGLRIWELLGLTQDPSAPTQDALFDVAITAVQPGTVGGNVNLRMMYLRNPDRGLIAASAIHYG